MWRIVLAVLATLGASIVCGALPSPAAWQSHGAALAAGNRSPDLLYIAARQLWLRSVDGGPARLVPLPWPAASRDGSLVSSVQWAPNTQRVAVDDGRGRLAIVKLASGHLTVLLGRRCAKNCPDLPFQWSPNGRYLAFLRPIGSGEHAILQIWDSSTGKTRQLASGVAGYVASPDWSHDSTRVAVAIGTMDPIKNRYPTMIAVNMSGQVVRLGSGLMASWSPDDRLIGLLHANFCGANTCDEDEIVLHSNGSAPVVLARHSTSLFDNPVWAPQPGGYAFDRWLLNAGGHPIRRLAGPHERILSWRTDGTRLALQTYYPYQGTPDVLYLATPAGMRQKMYTDGWNQGCGACSKDVYDVVWSQGTAIAFATPAYPTPKNVDVHPKLYLSPASGGASVRIPISVADYADILGFVERDSAVIIHSGKALYRYDVPSGRVTTLATGLVSQYSPAILEPAARVG